MTSPEIIKALALAGKLMELHDENAFKSRAFNNAAFRLSKLRYKFEGKSREEIAAVDGVGKSMAEKIMVMLEHGSFPELEALAAKTPPGVIDMLGVKGLGPKKISQLWKELGIESTGELLYACSENRLITLKGFGEKTQQQIKQSLEFAIASSNQFLYATLHEPAESLLQQLHNAAPAGKAVITGEMARRNEVINKVEYLVAGDAPGAGLLKDFSFPVQIHHCPPGEFGYHSVLHSSSPEHLASIGFNSLQGRAYKTEAEVYSALGLQFVPPELREGLAEAQLARKNRLPDLIVESDLKGSLHNHSTWSDGIHTIREMADYCMSKGLSYLGICDHSKSAFYANGLSEERVLRQQEEIDSLIGELKGFRILKGIESDILGDGSLDYPGEILKTFDMVVASVHSNLKMDMEKATARLIKAIENPYTTILGHPSGRLLLSRSGYPLDYKKIIDACAANGVHMEMNASPYRLDLDWRWIPYCLEKGVMISINPDAHHQKGIDDMYWGVLAARKGMLTKEMCLNACTLDDLLGRLRKR